MEKEERKTKEGKSKCHKLTNKHSLSNHVSVFPAPLFLKESPGLDSNLLHFTSMALKRKGIPEGFAGMMNRLLVFQTLAISQLRFG